MWWVELAPEDHGLLEVAKAGAGVMGAGEEGIGCHWLFGLRVGWV